MYNTADVVYDVYMNATKILIELPDDYSECETCERSFPMDDMHIDEVSQCDECDRKEMAYWGSLVGRLTRPVSRDDLDWFQPGDKEYREVLWELNR